MAPRRNTQSAKDSRQQLPAGSEAEAHPVPQGGQVQPEGTAVPPAPEQPVMGGQAEVVAPPDLQDGQAQLEGTTAPPAPEQPAMESQAEVVAPPDLQDDQGQPEGTASLPDRRMATVASVIKHDGDHYGPDDEILLTETEFLSLAPTGALVEDHWDDLSSDE